MLLGAYCGLIFVLSGRSQLLVPMSFPGEDKLIHAAAYGLMGLLAWMTCSREQRPRSVVFFVSVLFCSLYGLSDEWHQSFVPGRDASAGDWLADTLGGLLAATILLRLRRPEESGWKRNAQR